MLIMRGFLALLEMTDSTFVRGKAVCFGGFAAKTNSLITDESSRRVIPNSVRNLNLNNLLLFKTELQRNIVFTKFMVTFAN